VVTELGTKVDPDRDRVQVAGRRVEAEKSTYVLLNKPRGFVTTLSDPEGRPTVMQLIKGAGARVVPVGRLDFNTEGVLLLTNDGELLHALTHPSKGVEKTYRVKLRGTAGPDVARQLAEGVTLDDGSRTSPARVLLEGPTEGGRNTWLEITIHEGKNRQIHRMAESLGYQVAKLERVSFAGLDVHALKPGNYRHLVAREVMSLRKLAGLPARRKM
jgi:pseudouridine synthase